MPKIYGAVEAAAAIGCDPRALRRFLRSNDSYRNAGIGGRYMFTEAELSSLAKAFRKAHKQGKSTNVPTHEMLDQDKGVPVEKLTPRGLDPDLRKERAEARAARQQRLRARISEVLTERYDDEPVRGA